MIGSSAGQGMASPHGTARDPVSKAFVILEHLIDSGQAQWSLRALAKELKMPASTVHRTLTALRAVGMLKVDPDTSLYSFDDEIHRLSRRVVRLFPLPELAHEPLKSLAYATGETALLGLYDDDRQQLMFAAQVEGAHPLRYVVPLDTWIPLHRGASGLAILAFLPVASARRIVRAAEAENEVEVRDMEETLSGIRSRGYVITHGERISGATGIAAPVHGADERVLGDIVLTVPQTRFTSDLEQKYVRLVQETADRVTTMAGGSRDKAALVTMSSADKLGPPPIQSISSAPQDLASRLTDSKTPKTPGGA